MRLRSEEQRVELVEGLRGGEGITELHHLLELPDFHGAGRTFSYTVLRPGSSIGWHRHLTDFEAYYILRGEGEYNDNGQLLHVGPGDLLLCRPGEWHSFRNDGTAPVEYIALILYVQEQTADRVSGQSKCNIVRENATELRLVGEKVTRFRSGRVE